MKTHRSPRAWHTGVSANAMVSMNEGHRGVAFAHSTDEGSNDSGGKGADNKLLLLTKHRKHRRQTFYGKRESRNSQSRREIWQDPVVNEIRQL